MNPTKFIKHHFLLLFLMAVVTIQGNSQSAKIENLLTVNLNNIGNITDANGVAGYYFFYKFDKVSKKENSYIIQMYDNNFNPIKSITVVRSNRDNLIECTFNEEAFLLSFYDGKKYELVTYDKEGKKLGTKSYGKLSMMESAMLTAKASGQDKNKGIFALGTSGFVKADVFGTGKDKYVIEAFNSKFKSLWSFKSDFKDSKLNEVPGVIHSSENYVLMLVYRYKGLTGKDATVSFVLLDAKTGKKVTEIGPEKSKDPKSVLNCFLNEDKKEIVVIGEYFKPKANIMKDKSVGIYATKYNLGGDITMSNNISHAELKKASEKTASKGGKKSKDEKIYTYYHKTFQAPNGNLFIVGEQYKKVASTAGIIFRVLSFLPVFSSTASVVSIELMDIVAIELDDQLNLKQSQNIKKSPNIIPLPQGYGTLSASLLGKVLASWGEFDYAFSSEDKLKGRFFASYLSFIRKKDGGGKKGTNYVGTVIYDNGITTDKLNINTDADSYRVLPARPGYVSIAEYYRKKKTVEFRVEKIQYE